MVSCRGAVPSHRSRRNVRMTNLAGMREAHRAEMEEYFRSVIEERLNTSDGQKALKRYYGRKIQLGWLESKGAHPVVLTGRRELLDRARMELREVLGSEEILEFFLGQE